MSCPGPKNSGPNPWSYWFLVGGAYLGPARGWPPPGRIPGYVPAVALQWTEWAERGLIQQKKTRHSQSIYPGCPFQIA